MEIWVFYLLVGFLHRSEGLLCYQCTSSGDESECMTGYSSFTKVFHALSAPNATLVGGHGDTASETPHYKDCDGYDNRTMCVIEEVRNGFTGNVESFNRDCSDGVTFSISMPILYTDTPANFTACGYGNHGYQVCITLCNSTNFCNGPNEGTRNEKPSLLVLTALFGVFHACVKF